MKLVLKRALVGSAALMLAASTGWDAWAQMKYPSQTGRIAYKIESPMLNGTQVLSWVDGGKRTRQETTLTFRMGEKSVVQKGWIISDGKNLFIYQPGMMGNVVHRMQVPKDPAAGGTGLLGMPSPQAVGMGGRPIGNEKVLGRPCIVRQVSDSGKVWSWQGIPLKFQATNAQLQSISVEATKVETGIKLAASSFTVPKGMKIQVMDAKVGGAGALGSGGRPAAPKK